MLEKNWKKQSGLLVNMMERLKLPIEKFLKTLSLELLEVNYFKLYNCMILSIFLIE